MPTRRSTESVRSPESTQSREKAAPGGRTTPVKAPAGPEAGARMSVSESARRAMIEQAAYLRAERRGFVPGSEEEDWLAAEAEVDALLKAGHGRQPQ